MNNLIKAVLAVMNECKGVDKSMTVGGGNSSYKGVSDKDVKLKIGESMGKHGLVIFPIGIEEKTQIDRWEAKDYNGNPTTKQSVFTNVVTKYLLAHESGESIEVCGYGHGVDVQDKSAGKATTYALKNYLLYQFLVATGHVDDTDREHSDNIDIPQAANVGGNLKEAYSAEKLKSCASEKDLMAYYNSLSEAEKTKNRDSFSEQRKIINKTV